VAGVPAATLQLEAGIPDAAAEPAELQARAEAPAWGEPAAAHWGEPAAEQYGPRVRGGFALAVAVWIGLQSVELAGPADVVEAPARSPEFPDGKPVLPDAAVQALAVPRLSPQRQGDGTRALCKKWEADGQERAPQVARGLPQRIALGLRKLHGRAEFAPAVEPLAGRASQPTLERWGAPRFHRGRRCN